MKRFYLIALLLAGLAGCSAASEESGFSGAVKAITSGKAASSGSSGGSTTVTAPARPPANSTAPAAQTTYDANGMATGSTVPAAGLVHTAQIDPNPTDWTNIPGVQEIHYVMSPEHCKQLLDRLRGQGENLTGGFFRPSGMPGSPKAGQCKLVGPSAIDNRFVDRRSETDP
jgi:hypothetical protein